MSIEAIRCPGCKKLVNVANLEQHYTSNHVDGILPGATTITTANPQNPNQYPGPGGPWQYPPAQTMKRKLLTDPLWGPLIDRFFPHILFACFVLGAIVGIVLW
jgi:hypothetical protein